MANASLTKPTSTSAQLMVNGVECQVDAVNAQPCASKSLLVTVATGSDKTLTTLGAGSVEERYFTPMISPLNDLGKRIQLTLNNPIMEGIALCARLMSREVIRVRSSHNLLPPTTYP